MFNQKIQYILATIMFMMLLSFQVLRTQLRVIVKDDSGKLRPGTEVTLFNSIEDFNKDKKAYDSIIADKKGRAVFNKVGKGPYYLEAKNGEFTNDFGNQLTDTLKEGAINKIEVIISN